MSSKVLASNLVFNSAESSRISAAADNSVTFTVNSANMLHVTPERAVIAGNLSFSGNQTVTISTTNTSTDNMVVSGSLAVSTMNVTGNIQSSKMIRINDSLNITSQTGLRQNDQNLGTWTFINSHSFTSQANIVSPSLGGWKMLRIHFSNFRASVNNAVVQANISRDNGATYDLDAEGRYVSSSATLTTDSDVFPSGISVFRNSASQGLGGSATDGGGDATVTIMNWNASKNLVYWGVASQFLAGAGSSGTEAPFTTHGVGPVGPWNKMRFYSSTAGPPLLTGTIWYEGMK